MVYGEGMFHCYPAMAPLFPEATQALVLFCKDEAASLFGESKREISFTLFKVINDIVKAGLFI